ncbi:MAG: histidine phosphatase family protein [Gammaproteobacteria bacterium]|jgi:phosphohistidine phosphatase
MRRQLLLMRHARAEDRAVSDFTRNLSPHGRRQATMLGEHMAGRGWRPDCTLCSPALRAVETWDGLREALATERQPHFIRCLYNATPAALLAELRRVDETAGTLLVIGHNPGVALLASALAAPNSEPAARERLSGGFPAAAMAVFEVDEQTWADLDEGRARLIELVDPENRY